MVARINIAQRCITVELSRRRAGWGVLQASRASKGPLHSHRHPSSPTPASCSGGLYACPSKVHEIPKIPSEITGSADVPSAFYAGIAELQLRTLRELLSPRSDDANEPPLPAEAGIRMLRTASAVFMGAFLKSRPLTPEKLLGAFGGFFHLHPPPTPK